MKKRWLLIALPIALGLAMEPLPVGAADPPSGTITPTTKTVTWTGPMNVVGFNPTNTAQDTPTCAPTPVLLECDVFELTVDIPETGYSTSGGVKIDITFTSANSDYDVFVFDESGTVVGSSTGSFGAQESIILPRATGVYMVQVNPWLVVNDQYTGVAEAFGLVKPKPKKKPKKK